MTTRRYSHIMHLESTVVGDLRPGRTAYDALVATFPAGTLSGAPKPRAMALIDEYEGLRRGRLRRRRRLPRLRRRPRHGHRDPHGGHQGRGGPRAGRRGHRRRLGAAAGVRGDAAQGGGGHPGGPGGAGYACARPRRRRRGRVSCRVPCRDVGLTEQAGGLGAVGRSRRSSCSSRRPGRGSPAAPPSRCSAAVSCRPPVRRWPPVWSPSALVCLVALVTTLTGGPVVRRVSSVVLVLAAAGSVALTVAPAHRPGAGPRPRRRGRAGPDRGRPHDGARCPAWAWTALVAGVVLFPRVAARRRRGRPVVRAVQPVRGPRRRERRRAARGRTAADPGRDRPRRAPHDVGRAERGPRPDPGPGGRDPARRTRRTRIPRRPRRTRTSTTPPSGRVTPRAAA